MRKLKTISKKDLKNIKGGKNDIGIEDIVVLPKSIKDSSSNIKSGYDLIVDDLVITP